MSLSFLTPRTCEAEAGLSSGPASAILLGPVSSNNSKKPKKPPLGNSLSQVLSVREVKGGPCSSPSCEG